MLRLFCDIGIAILWPAIGAAIELPDRSACSRICNSMPAALAVQTVVQEVRKGNQAHSDEYGHLPAACGWTEARSHALRRRHDFLESVPLGDPQGFRRGIWWECHRE